MTKLAAHRDLLGRVLAAGDELDSMRPGWLEMQAGYESLSTWLDHHPPARPAAVVAADGGEGDGTRDHV